MNRTLFDCGFKKEVELKNGKLYDVTATLPKAVQKQTYDFKCGICSQIFFRRQHLEMHIKFKHPAKADLQNGHSVGQSGSSAASTSHNSFVDLCLQGNSQPEERITLDKQKKGTENRRGSSKRKSYTVEFKKQTLDLLDSLANSKNKWKKVADEKQVSNCLVVKWNKARESILAEISKNKHKRNAGSAREARRRRQMVGKKAQKSEKYPLAANLLITEFKLRRAKGSKISKLWLKTKMKKKIESCYGKEEADKFKASNNWFQRFKRRHNISLRRRTNKKKNAANDGRETIQRFHRDLRKAVQSKRRRDTSFVADQTYGRWLPKNRLNVDQVPLPFVVEQDQTYEFEGNKQVWISQPGSGLDKRQATLQLCIKAEGEQTVKPAIIFRGKGNVFSAEQEKYDADVHVYFQSNAWMDAEVNLKWTKHTLKDGLKDDFNTEKVLFADNVGFQQTQAFHEACREMNTIVYLLPDNHTDKVQPVDAGFGRMMKQKIGEAMQMWLEKEENLEMWHDKISAKNRRILMTQWTGHAWRELVSKPDFIRKLFEKTGCLITADGSQDEKIRPQGLDAYTF